MTQLPFARSEIVSSTFQPAPEPVVSTTENGSIERLVSWLVPLRVTGAKSLMPGWPGGPKSSVPACVAPRERRRAHQRDRTEDPDQTPLAKRLRPHDSYETPRGARPHSPRTDLIGARPGEARIRRAGLGSLRRFGLGGFQGSVRTPKNPGGFRRIRRARARRCGRGPG